MTKTESSCPECETYAEGHDWEVYSGFSNDPYALPSGHGFKCRDCTCQWNDFGDGEPEIVDHGTTYKETQGALEGTTDGNTESTQDP